MRQIKRKYFVNIFFNFREVPRELIRESRGREVHLQMEDHRMEEFISKRSRFQVSSQKYILVSLYLI